LDESARAPLAKSTTGESRTDLGRRWRAHATLAFALVLGLGLARHEMWRDELQAWTLVRASPSLPALFANLRYEGHPPLWHLLLFPLVHAGLPPAAMQALHGIVATLGVAAFLAWAPLPFALRAAFVASYLPLFEYGVVSRNYALALPLVWGICRLWGGRGTAADAQGGARRWVLLGAALALLAQANPYAWLLAAALAGTFLVEGIADRERRGRLARDLPAAGTGAALALVGLGFAVWRMLPPADSLYARGVHVWFLPRALRAAGTVAAAYLPLPDPRAGTPWNSALVYRVAPLPLAVLALIGLLLAFLLLRTRAARLLFVLGTVALLGFTYVEYIGFARHHGHHVVLLLACCWLDAAAMPEGPRRARLALVGFVLAVHLATGAWLYGADLRRPFSGAKTVAARLRQPPLAGLPPVGTPDVVLPAVGGYLGQPLLSLESGAAVEFMRWRADTPPTLAPPAVCARLLSLAHEHGGPLAFVAPPRTLPPEGCPGLDATRIDGFGPRPLVPSEWLGTWRVDTVR
jgi:hypothetical protein